MTKRLLTTIVVMLTLTALHRPADAALTITSEALFHQYMDQIVNGSLTPKDCPDPNPDYAGKYCYFEITQSFNLTKPISIPANVHLTGKMDKVNPTLTFGYDIVIYPGVNHCMMRFDGDSVILENVIIDAKDTFALQALSAFHDSAICMNKDFGVVNSVTITTYPKLSTPQKEAITDGITVNGSNNTVKNNTITSLGYGMVFNAKGQGQISGNNVTGDIAFIFSTSAQIPVGQAANIMIFNTAKDSGNVYSSLQSYPVEYKIKLPLIDCGTCKTATDVVKVSYRDDGTCANVPASGNCVDPIAPPPNSEALAGTVPVTPISTETTTATPDSPTPQMVPTSAMSSGGCSLIRPQHGG